MNITSTGLELRPLLIPTSVDDDDATDFAEMVRVRNIVYREIAGNDDESITPGELLPVYQPDDYQKRFVWIAVQDGEVVGRVGIDVPFEKGSRVAFWLIELLRRVQGRGIGSTAHALIEQTARAHGRSVLQSWAEHPDAPGERITAPTGFGSVPVDHAAQFYRRHGYTLEQVERKSSLDLTPQTARRVDALLDEARRASSGYRVQQWFLPTPPEYVAGYAWMKSRMITDAPAAAIEFDEEVWDAARLANHEAPYLASGRLMLVTAAQHVETGEVVAFNELVVGNDRSEATSQEDTLVLKEHRGHKLGLLVKCAALTTWRDVTPLSPRVITYNAEENRPMLDINETIGFAPIAYTGAWKKVLDD